MAADTETSNQSPDQLRAVSYNDDKGYELSGKIMLGAIVVLVFVLVFMAGTHIYFKWYLHRLRRTQAERLRRRRGVRRSHANFYTATGDIPSAAADRGLETSVLNSLPVFLHSGGDKDTPSSPPPPECAVCLSEFEESEIIRLLPKCGHAFHIKCIDLWFKSHSTCPLCRAGVEPVVANGSVGLPPEWCGPSSSSRVGGEKVVEVTTMSVQVPDNNSSWGDENSGNLSSPMMRKMLSLRRILSMGRRLSPGRGGGGMMMAAVAETSGGGRPVNEVVVVDLESGVIDRESSQNRVGTSSLS